MVIKIILHPQIKIYLYMYLNRYTGRLQEHNSGKGVGVPYASMYYVHVNVTFLLTKKNNHFLKCSCHIVSSEMIFALD